MQKWADQARKDDKRICLVPTMGYFHEGHLSLMRIGRKQADRLVVSLFVNPTQFAPHEDFDAYPRDFDRDADMAKKEGVDVIFAPGTGNIYPEGFQTYVELSELPRHLCGLSRPAFFKGVSTVVAKLFNIVKPHIAVFGEKDYQQLLIIKRMARDLNYGIKIIPGPIVREPDGLAMSSRNTYLSVNERKSALSLSKALFGAKEIVSKGKRDAVTIKEMARQMIEAHPENRIDYISICDPETLVEAETIDRPLLMALAVFVGKTRLIDNMLLVPP